MVCAAEGASSSNPIFNSTQRWKYHVFLSFRGSDSRKSFTDYLYAELQKAGIITFRDDELLEKGEIISEQLHDAIKKSLFAIVVLSPNYSSSAWCLDELQKIMESRRLQSIEVFPVFYNVDPSDVSDQSGSFSEAFIKHEQRYKEDEVKRWRNALKEVADLSGYLSQLIEEIVAVLWTKLLAKLPAFDDGLIGIHSKMADMLSLLGRGSVDVRFIGIWGMGGIGKTTLAKVVYDKICNEFEISCFLANVREISGDRGHGLVQLQEKLLSHLKIRSMEIRDSYQGRETIRNLLFNKKVLLVLDDVSDDSQVENLAGNQEWFGEGSRVIITTRDSHLLTSHGLLETYPIQILNTDESFQLFRQKAFKDQPIEKRYSELSENVVQYAGGLPLALKVLSSFLRGRSLPEWEDALKKMKSFLHKDIESTLRISYEALDDSERNTFLHVACFLKGMDEDKVTHILQICNFYPRIGIKVLLEKSLLTKYYVSGKLCLGMHDLLQEMGRNIVIHESVNDAGKRSRLWLQEDIDYVLTKNKGSESIQGITFESESHKALWDPKAVLKMYNLKVLMLRIRDLPLGLVGLSKELKYLEWNHFPLDELPLDNQLDELVELKMLRSKIKQPWHGTKSFRELKLIDLSFSKDLVRFPSVLEIPCLEQLILEGCSNLVEVDQSVGQLKELILLNLQDCVNLKILPSRLEMDSLKDFIISGCSKVKKLPEFGDNMKSLSNLDLLNCKSLVCLPNSIHNLKSLRLLNIFGCSKFSRLPENLGANESLEELNVRGSAIKEVPPSIILLKDLKRLSIGGHRQKESNSWSLSTLTSRLIFWRFPVSTGIIFPPISPFSCLEELDLSYCNLSNESLLVDLGCLLSLLKLNLSGNNFINLPASIGNLSKLYHIALDCCPRLESVPVLPPHIGSLYGRNSASWKPFSDPQYLRDFFASHLREHSERKSRQEEPFLFIAGSDIPPWFSNQSYFHRDLRTATMQPLNVPNQSLASIMVDIPHYCLSSEWWGIAVCLVLENPFSASGFVYNVISWICKSAKAELLNATAKLYPLAVTDFRGPHLLILLLRGNDRNIQLHLKDDHNKLQLFFHAYARLKVRKCGCRVLCKEDLEAWTKARDERRQNNNFEIPSGSSFNRSIVRDVRDDNQCWDDWEEEYVNTSNAEAKRRKLG